MKSLIINVLVIVSFAIILSSVTGCKKKGAVKITLNTTEISLKVNESSTLVVSPSINNVVFTSDNDTIAEVFATGEIVARLVGETNIIATNIESGARAICKVTVIPSVSMYKEPFLVFSTPKLSIKTYETRELNLENDSTILYNGENSFLDSLTYSFKNAAYTSCICVVPADKVGLLGSYLGERYAYIGSIAYDLIARKTTDGKTFVVTQTFSDTELLVYYFPRSASGSKSALSQNSEIIRNIRAINSTRAFHHKE